MLNAKTNPQRVAENGDSEGHVWLRIGANPVRLRSLPQETAFVEPACGVHAFKMVRALKFSADRKFAMVSTKGERRNVGWIPVVGNEGEALVKEIPSVKFIISVQNPFTGKECDIGVQKKDTSDAICARFIEEFHSGEIMKQDTREKLRSTIEACILEHMWKRISLAEDKFRQSEEEMLAERQEVKEKFVEANFIISQYDDELSRLQSLVHSIQEEKVAAALTAEEEMKKHMSVEEELRVAQQHAVHESEELKNKLQKAEKNYEVATSQLSQALEKSEEERQAIETLRQQDIAKMQIQHEQERHVAQEELAAALEEADKRRIATTSALSEALAASEKHKEEVETLRRKSQIAHRLRVAALRGKLAQTQEKETEALKKAASLEESLKQERKIIDGHRNEMEEARKSLQASLEASELKHNIDHEELATTLAEVEKQKMELEKLILHNEEFHQKRIQAIEERHHEEARQEQVAIESRMSQLQEALRAAEMKRNEMEEMTRSSQQLHAEQIKAMTTSHERDMKNEEETRLTALAEAEKQRQSAELELGAAEVKVKEMEIEFETVQKARRDSQLHHSERVQALQEELSNTKQSQLAERAKLELQLQTVTQKYTKLREKAKAKKAKEMQKKTRMKVLA